MHSRRRRLQRFRRAPGADADCSRAQARAAGWRARDCGETADRGWRRPGEMAGRGSAGIRSICWRVVESRGRMRRVERVRRARLIRWRELGIFRFAQLRCHHCPTFARSWRIWATRFGQPDWRDQRCGGFRRGRWFRCRGGDAAGRFPPDRHGCGQWQRNRGDERRRRAGKMRNGRGVRRLRARDEGARRERRHPRIRWRTRAKAARRAQRTKCGVGIRVWAAKIVVEVEDEEHDAEAGSKFGEGSQQSYGIRAAADGHADALARTDEAMLAQIVFERLSTATS